MSEKYSKLQEEFELTPSTIAILPIQYGSRLYSKIISVEEEILSPYKPLDIIKKACKYYASSYKGRKEGTKALIGASHKAPIVIDPLQSIYFFPTASPNSPNCAWISHEHVNHYKATQDGQTEIIFRNKKTILFPVSLRTFEMQMFRTALLRTKVQQRLSEHELVNRLLLSTDPIVQALERRRNYYLTSKDLFVD